MQSCASSAVMLLVAFSASASGAAIRFGARSRAVPAARRLVRRAATTDASSETAAPTGPTDVKTILECNKDMSDIVSLCKRRGFVFPSSEIYSGFAGFFDYGPLGVELRNNIKKAWWQDMVQRRDDVVGLDSSIIGSPRIWEASGHVAGFSDPMVDCKETKQRFRADQLFYSKVSDASGAHAGYVSLLECADMEAVAAKAAGQLLKKLKLTGPAQLTPLRDFTEADPSEYSLIPSPATGEPGTLTAPRDFNLMFQTSVGAMTDGSSVAYLRPETAQGIFTNFKNVVSSTRVKVPFGIAQIGKVREWRAAMAAACLTAWSVSPACAPIGRVGSGGWTDILGPGCHIWLVGVLCLRAHRLSIHGAQQPAARPPPLTAPTLRPSRLPCCLSTTTAVCTTRTRRRATALARRCDARHRHLRAALFAPVRRSAMRSRRATSSSARASSSRWSSSTS